MTGHPTSATFAGKQDLDNYTFSDTSGENYKAAIYKLDTGKYIAATFRRYKDADGTIQIATLPTNYVLADTYSEAKEKRDDLVAFERAR